MRILYLSHYFYPEGNAPAGRVHEMARRWVRLGHRVQVITCAPNVPNGVVYEGYSNRLRKTEYVDGIKVTRIWTYLAANKGILRRTLNYLSYMVMAVLNGIFMKRPDIIIATSPQFFCGWAGIFLSRLRRVPFILEIRDIWPASIVAVEAMKKRRMFRVLEVLEKRMYASADHIVTVGEGYRQRLIEKGVSEGKISVVTNGVDPERFSPRPPDQALGQELGLNGDFVCGYVGTIGMASGLDIVLRAAKCLRERGRTDICFLIVGGGAVLSELEAKAAKLGLGNITFVGRQAKERIPAFLSLVDVCLVHLKGAELFKTVMPSKIFEAAGMGKPIILGVRGFAERTLKEAGAGIAIEPDNEEELVEALIRLADDRGLCRQYGDAARQYFTQRCNFDRLAGRYLKITDIVSRARKSKVRTTRVAADES